MLIATFGPKAFNVSLNRIYTFDDYNRSGSLNIEDQEVEGEKPSSYIKGSSLEEISFAVQLISQININIRNEIDDWFKIMNEATPYLLIIGEKIIGNNKYLLTSVSESESKFDGNGRYIKATLQLKFKEFVRYGSKKDDAETSSESKSSKKRKNTNAEVSIEQGAEMDALENELFGG